MGRELHCISGWVLNKVHRDVGSSCWILSWFPWVRQLGRWQSRRRKVCSLRPPRRSSPIRGRGRWTRERSWGQRRQQRVTWGAGWCTWSMADEKEDEGDVVCCRARMRLGCCRRHRPAKLLLASGRSGASSCRSPSSTRSEYWISPIDRNKY